MATPGERSTQLLAVAVQHHQAGRLDQAEPLYHQLLVSVPNHVDGLHNLGFLHYQLGRHASSADLLRKAVAARPDYVLAHVNLGNTLLALGELNEAAAAYRRAVELKPDFGEAYINLGNVLGRLGDRDGAIARFRQAAALRPDLATAHNNLGAALKDAGALEEAAGALSRAITLQPRLAAAHNNLGLVLKAQWRFEEAATCFRRAIGIDADFASAHYNLGNVLGDLGELEEAAESYRRALVIDPGFPTAAGNRLFTLNYSAELSAAEIFQAYAAYGASMMGRQIGAHGNAPTGDRRLKLGYLSPDLRAHSSRHFLEPLLENHARAEFEVFAYPEIQSEDEVTRRYQRCVDHWRPTNGLSDQAVAAQIMADEIDILIDLAGHTKGSRLGVMALKPAPVSVTYLGYAYTTGLSAIDYFLTDAVMAPAGSEALFSEAPWRLDRCSYVYRPAEGMGAASTPPAAANGHVTFGSLSRSIRINDPTLQTWAALLLRVPGSRLVINSGDFQHPSMQARLLARFAARGIGPERLEVGYETPAAAVLARIDIGLDCFPHNSGTTLFESLYMGVPFVTLASRPSVGRLGSSILTSLGRPDWIAADEEGYVRAAAALASDLEGLAKIRAGLQAQMQASPLMDERGFTRDIEASYRAMWAKWCDVHR